MTPAETLTLAAYFFVLIILAVYGWHRYYLVYLYLSHRDKEPKPAGTLDPLPVVTIQLPLYNEMYVADRLVAAGVRSILNFAPAVISVPPNVPLRKVDLATELQILSFYQQGDAPDVASQAS